MWSKKRIFIQTSSGRQRFNVLGAINPLNQKLLKVECLKNTDKKHKEKLKKLLNPKFQSFKKVQILSG